MPITQSENHITHTKVKAGDWIHDSLRLPYYGKYQVGRFTLSNEFMIQYMKVIHNISIASNETQSDYMTAPDTIIYMEHYGIIDSSTLTQMREIVKRPKKGFSVLRENNLITGIYKDNDYE